MAVEHGRAAKRGSDELMGKCVSGREIGRELHWHGAASLTYPHARM